METTKRDNELLTIISNILNENGLHPINFDEKFNDAIHASMLEVYNSRQSEFDNLTNEKDAFKKECGELLVKLTKYEINNKSNKCELLEQNTELTKDNSEVVDLLKSYCIKCDEQTNEIERLKKEREALIDNFSGDKLMKQQKHFVSLYGSDEMGQEKANSFAVGFGKAAELMCNKLTTN